MIHVAVDRCEKPGGAVGFLRERVYRRLSEGKNYGRKWLWVLFAERRHLRKGQFFLRKVSEFQIPSWLLQGCCLTCSIVNWLKIPFIADCSDCMHFISLSTVLSRVKEQKCWHMLNLERGRHQRQLWCGLQSRKAAFPGHKLCLEGNWCSHWIWLEWEGVGEVWGGERAVTHLPTAVTGLIEGHIFLLFAVHAKTCLGWVLTGIQLELHLSHVVKELGKVTLNLRKATMAKGLRMHRKLIMVV